MLEAIVLAAYVVAAEPIDRKLITAVGVFTVSHHGKRDPEYNEVNPGVFVEAGKWHFGGYVNTYKRLTAYVVRDFEIVDRRGWRLSFQVGPASGYRFPAVAAFRLTKGPVAVYFLPPVAGHSYVAALAFRKELR